MQPSTPPRAAGHTPSSADLPYGPLPVRSRRTTPGPPGSTPLEQLVDLSWLESEVPPPEAEVVEDSEPVAGEDASSETALAMSLTTPKPETDDDVHFGPSLPGRSASRARRSNGWSNADSSSVDRPTLRRPSRSVRW